MQRQPSNLSVFVCVLVNVAAFALAVNAQQMVADQRAPSSAMNNGGGPSQMMIDYETLDKDSLSGGRDILALDEAATRQLNKEVFLNDLLYPETLARSTNLKWYGRTDSRPSILMSPERFNRLLASASTTAAGRSKLEPVVRQFAKKQTHLKKNNPRDILRGLAVKRDRFYK